MEYNFQDDSNSIKLDLTGGDAIYLTTEMDASNADRFTDMSSGDFDVAFYNSADELISVTGDIYVEVIRRNGDIQTPSGGDYPIDGSTVIYPADAVSGASPTTYVVPYFVGSFVQARVRFESIVGTDLSYAKATLTKWK